MSGLGELDEMERETSEEELLEEISHLKSKLEQITR